MKSINGMIYLSLHQYRLWSWQKLGDVSCSPGARDWKGSCLKHCHEALPIITKTVQRSYKHCSPPLLEDAWQELWTEFSHLREFKIRHHCSIISGLGKSKQGWGKRMHPQESQIQQKNHPWLGLGWRTPQPTEARFTDSPLPQWSEQEENFGMA